MPLVFRQPDPRPSPARRFGALLTVVMAASGCQSTNGTWAAWRTAADDSLSKGPTKDELGDNRNLMARWLTPRAAPSTTSAKDEKGASVVLGSNGWKPIKALPNPEAEAEFDAAERLFQQGKFEEAEAEFKKIAKNRKGSSWGMKSQYFLAESLYQRGKLVAAHDNYEKLLADYPGTEYLDKAVSREFQIGNTWLAQYATDAKPDQRIPWTGRFNGRRPALDTNGTALQALEHVRQHDPTGPLADDAVMKIADQHMNSGDYESAAIYYDQLVTDHPKSPFLQRAQLAAIDARMKNYIGPSYDGTDLEKARDMIKQTMATFPDRAAGNEKLYHTLDVINDAEAEHDYKVAEYYKRTGKITSAEFYFGKVRQRWPKSPYAVKAKTELAALAKMPRKEFKPSKIMAQPGSNDPNNPNGGMGGGGMGGMGGGGMGGMGMGGMGMGGMGGPG